MNGDDRVAAADKATAELRDATREAHETIKTLRLLQREIRDTERTVRDLLRDEPFEMVTEAVSIEVKRAADQVQESQEQAIDQLGEYFNKLTSAYLKSYGLDLDMPVSDAVDRLRTGPLPTRIAMIDPNRKRSTS